MTVSSSSSRNQTQREVNEKQKIEPARGCVCEEGVNYVQIILRGFHRLDVQNKISPILGIYFLQDQNNLHSMFVAPKLYDLKSSEKCKVL